MPNILTQPKQAILVKPRFEDPGEGSQELQHTLIPMCCPDLTQAERQAVLAVICPDMRSLTMAEVAEIARQRAQGDKEMYRTFCKGLLPWDKQLEPM